ncbi:DNA cytosine methyltransferase [Acinetobacter sp. ANC 3813]|uniref:DNA cytosine methyltransferase n=1 Tax=Acinetobacter sp. ANC 3813 TaxID=1977873 RepID=UPI000A33A6C0|nr:DNA cytosine methyltransferase [Acinetobacter sp. ANC 3813]OTG87913.1 hypothetical protein B9T34_16400 [Acinetobacter sp. ANC 3813]
MKFGSVCSGIEAASVAWDPIGWKAEWFAEIMPFPSAVLAHRWPEVPNLGNMTKIAEMIKDGTCEAPDVLVGGTPCQAFSIIGSKESLNDERGRLTLEYVRILNEIDSVRSIRGDEPSVAVWENVEGVLKTSDNAFGCLLGALAGEECELKPTGGKWTHAGCVYGPRRTVAWRVFDAKYFGVAQRRRRIFIVASSADWINPAEVLLECESLQGSAAEGGKERNDFTASIRASAATTGGQSIDDLGYLLFEPRSPDGRPRIMKDQSVSPTLTRMSGGGRRPCVLIDGKIREFLPTECEALQGFPENYTKVPFRGKPADKCPDGHRYEACGNSMPVPVMRWIGERIEAAVQRKREEKILGLIK